jgi:hypothetical protein
MSHNKIFFEGMNNGSSNYKCDTNVLDLGDIGHVREYRRCLLTVDCFKGSHVNGNVVRCVIPPFSEW